MEKIIGPKPTHDVSGPSEKHRCGFLNWNMHLEEMNVHHQPLLVAIKDVIPDERERWELIQTCWVQRNGRGPAPTRDSFSVKSPAISTACSAVRAVCRSSRAFGAESLISSATPTACRVRRASSPNRSCRACERCGACLHLAGRRDAQNVDDVSASNLVELQQIGSPRVKRGEVEVYDIGVPYDQREVREGWEPMDYVKGQRPPDQSAAAHKRKGES